MLREQQSSVSRESLTMTKAKAAWVSPLKRATLSNVELWFQVLLTQR